MVYSGKQTATLIRTLRYDAIYTELQQCLIKWRFQCNIYDFNPSKIHICNHGVLQFSIWKDPVKLIPVLYYMLKKLLYNPVITHVYIHSIDKNQLKILFVNLFEPQALRIYSMDVYWRYS